MQQDTERRHSMKDITEMMTEEQKEQYATHLRRLGYDEGDYVMVKNMLDFLWGFITGRTPVEDIEPFCKEYARWNRHMIDKVFCHEHDLPYADICRCYQTVTCLAGNDPEEGYRALEAIRSGTFSSDGLAPKLRMDARGRVFRPMSRLFIIYNFAKYYQKHGMVPELERLKSTYDYAFTEFGDEDHEAHDRYLKEQLEDLSDRIFYPISERVYKTPWGPREFYLFSDENSYILL